MNKHMEFRQVRAFRRITMLRHVCCCGGLLDVKQNAWMQATSTCLLQLPFHRIFLGRWFPYRKGGSLLDCKKGTRFPRVLSKHKWTRQGVHMTGPTYAWWSLRIPPRAGTTETPRCERMPVSVLPVFPRMAPLSLGRPCHCRQRTRHLGQEASPERIVVCGLHYKKCVPF